MHKGLTYAAMLAGMALALPPVTASAATKTKVDISTYSYNGPGNGGQFQIEVKSKEKICKNKRKVTLFREASGGKVKVGAGKTISGEGTYVAIINDPGEPTLDAYYATVKKEDGCAAARSEYYFLPNRSAPRAAKTNLTINLNGQTFFGQAKSRNAGCENGRTVNLYLKRDGQDEKVGTDKTGPGKGDTEGVWVIGLSSLEGNGEYYAKVKPKGDCDGDKSKTVIAEV